MSSFIAICNPVDVWDFEGYFAQNPNAGYWVVTKKVFGMAKAGDDLFLRVTSKSKFEGVCARFKIKDRRVMEVEKEFWRPDRHPDGLQKVLLFEVVSYFPEKRITKADLEMAGLPMASKLLKVPQTLVGDIPEDEGRILNNMIDRRLSN